MSLNYSIIIKITGLISLILGISMLPSLIVSYLYDDPSITFTFGLISLPLIIVGLLILLLTRNISKSFKIRDGYFAVTFCWITASLLGSLPYYLSGTVASFGDAIFESTAAFTTTNCSIISNLDLPLSIVLWKAVSHWVGGLGIIIFAISILPALGINSLKLGSPEADSPNLNKVKTQISGFSKTLYLIYLGLTVLEFVLLLFGKMGVFEAVINTLGSVSTSGISTSIPSISSYDSFYIESIISIFTFLASINFMLFFFAFNGKWKTVARDTELRAFILIIFISFVIISATLFTSGTYATFQEAMRVGIFQIVSFSTTSGYFIADYTLWPTFTQSILFTLMFIGGCAASTCGSFKVIRFVVILKLILRGFRKRLHPRSIVAVRIGKSVASPETVSSITVFAMLYLMIYLFTALVLSLDNLDMTTTLTAAAGILSNTGIAFGDLGPTADFSIFSPPIRLFISFMLIVGRLEILTVLLLFTPYFWNLEK
ncbi:MAG: TrkH family potassium uptake protein [Peptostreptococcaceae bacterium]|nr:TrkH family potassium uptake protein [Peptostreptococcaceae bacterium]